MCRLTPPCLSRPRTRGHRDGIVGSGGHATDDATIRRCPYEALTETLTPRRGVPVVGKPQRLLQASQARLENAHIAVMGHFNSDMATPPDAVSHTQPSFKPLKLEMTTDKTVRRSAWDAYVTEINKRPAGCPFSLISPASPLSVLHLGRVHSPRIGTYERRRGLTEVKCRALAAAHFAPCRCD